MNWIQLTEIGQLDEINKSSITRPVLIFKHSTRCSISNAALGRLNREFPENDFQAYYLDLLRYREISNRIEANYGIEHQSPQVLIIKNGKCEAEASHFDINKENIEAHI